MKLLPIHLYAKAGNWQAFNSRAASPQYKATLKKILKRDEYICRYCGFHSDRYMMVVNHDHDYTHNRPDNMVTACPLCAQCFFLDSIGIDEKTGGKLIYCPEMSQADLNNFCRILFCMIDGQSRHKTRLQSLYFTLQNRTKPVDVCFGPNTSQPRVFAQGLIDTFLKPEQIKHQLMGSVRLLPNKSAFKEPMAYWQKDLLNTFQP